MAGTCWSSEVQHVNGCRAHARGCSPRTLLGGTGPVLNAWGRVLPELGLTQLCTCRHPCLGSRFCSCGRAAAPQIILSHPQLFASLSQFIPFVAVSMALLASSTGCSGCYTCGVASPRLHPALSLPAETPAQPCATLGQMVLPLPRTALGAQAAADVSSSMQCWGWHAQL